MRKIEKVREVNVFGSVYEVIDPIRKKYEWFVVENDEVRCFEMEPQYDEDECGWYAEHPKKNRNVNTAKLGYVSNEYKSLNIPDQQSLTFIEYNADDVNHRLVSM